MRHSTRVQSMKSVGPYKVERRSWAVAGIASMFAIMAVTAWSAVEQARVISRTPVLEQVLVPRDACRDETATVQSAKSGAGAVIGNRLEPAPATRVITTRRCINEQVIEHRIAGYEVVYELGGKQYQARLDRDPGETLAVEIAPIQSSAVLTAPIQATRWVTAPVGVYPVGVQYVYVDDRRDRGYRDRDRRKHRHGD